VGSLGGTQYDMYAAIWMYGTRMPVVDVLTWPRGGRCWLGVDRREHRSSKRVDCDILTQDLIGLIEYSYHQGIHSFLKVHLQRTLGLNMLDLEQF
jgi:hypothetical protein